VPNAISWRVLQIADSAFPTGGFAHSAGLEAALQLGQARTVDGLDAHLRAILWNVGTASLPFVGETHDRPQLVWEMDERVDTFLTNHVANRASRTQGRAFVGTCARVFCDPTLTAMAARSRTREVTAHYAPLFGASLAALGFERRDALALYMYLSLRGIVSAAVRLGIVGPYEAQRLQHRQAATLDATIEQCAGLSWREAATTAPLIDLFAGAHDRLYTRLFQS